MVMENGVFTMELFRHASHSSSRNGVNGFRFLVFGGGPMFWI